jgi:hypothetical protein
MELNRIKELAGLQSKQYVSEAIGSEYPITKTKQIGTNSYEITHAHNFFSFEQDLQEFEKSIKKLGQDFFVAISHDKSKLNSEIHNELENVLPILQKTERLLTNSQHNDEFTNNEKLITAAYAKLFKVVRQCIEIATDFDTYD